MIRGAIFDADGTLFDSMPIWSGVGSGYLRTLGIEAKEDLDERFREMSLYQSAVCLKEEYSLPLSIEQISDGINKMVEHFYAAVIELKPGVKDFLEKLRIYYRVFSSDEKISFQFMECICAGILPA